jgi:archaellum component FlaC
MIIQINSGLIQLFVAIEALLVIVWGVVKGGINMRRLVFAGAAVIFAFALPWVLSHLVPGFGNATTYQLLQRYAEGAENTWGFVYQLSSKVMLIDAGAMTALNIIELISTFGLASIPQQYMGVLMNLGWTLDPIDAIVESINHAAQVLLAIFHTIAWLAWFSWAIAPTILGIALALIIPERTRPAGTALLLLTLAIMFFTSLAAYTLGLNQEAQLINSINQTLATIEGDLPSNVTIRGFLLLQSNYPYLVSGQLINETWVCGRACYPVLQPVSWFIGFTPSVGVIDQFAYPQINNATLLWLSVNPNHQCNLLVWPPNRNITQGPILEQCNPQLFDNNETFAEVISLGNPPFNLIGEELPNGTVYTGAWEWVNPPTSYSVSDGNNTVVINATINIPPIHCINITTRTGPHRECFPGHKSADLWLWASSINYPTSLGGGNWTCTLSLTNSSRYPVVDLTQEFNTMEAFMNKLINETKVSKKLIYPNASVPTYKLPNPTPSGYHQWELGISCENSNNYTVVVPLTIVIHGVGNNPWFASVPYLISPSDEWIINTTIIGDEPLLINWWDVDVKQFLGLLGIPIAQWLAEIAIIYGVLDGVAWFFGLPTILSPVYAIMQGVIMELSLVLYLQIRAIGRLMQRAVRKITKSIGTRLQGTYQALSDKHPKLAKALTASGSAVSRARQFLHEHLGSWVAHHRVVNRVINHITSPTAARAARIVLSPWHQGLSEVEARLEEKARLYESMGLRRKAQLYRFAAGTTRFVRDYGKIRSLSERGLLFQYTRRELSKLGEEPTQLTQSLTKEGEGGLVTYRLSPQLILLDWPRQLRRLAPSLARITERTTWAVVIEILEKTLGKDHPTVKLVRHYYKTGNKAMAYALALAAATGRRIMDVKGRVLLTREDLGEIERALRNWEGFVIKHIGDKTIAHPTSPRLTHILESLKSFGGYGGDVGEALGKAIALTTTTVRANLTRGALKGEYANEVVSRLKPIRDFVEAASKGAIVSLNHPVIQRFIDFVGPESERVVREVFNTKGLIDKDAANEIINRLKLTIQRRVSEEVEAARYIVALRYHAGEVVREFARELGIDRRVSEIEGEVKELGEFARRVTMSTLPMPRERITNPELLGEFREVGGGRVVLRESLDLDVRIDLQTPKEILGDEELSKLTTAWLTNYYADRLHGWFIRSPADAIYYTSLYKALTPEAEVLAILFASGIDPARLDWGGLLDEKERIEERMDRVKAQLKETKDEGEKAKLREELGRLKEEYENTLRALFHWANAFNAFLSTLPSEERERIYKNLPNKLRDYIDTARDPRDVYEAYVKNVARKIEGMKRRLGRAGGEGEEEGGWVRIDDVAEMRELIRNRLPRLDALIEPVRAELIDALTRRVNEVISELGNDQLTRAMLEQALNELRGGDLDNAVRQLRNAIENLRQVTREGEELAMDVRRLDELTKQLETVNALMRLARG